MLQNKDYTINMQTKELRYANGSRIYFVPLKKQPADPEFNRLWWYEITHAFVDEAQEVERKAIDVIKSRLTEKVKEYNLVWKILMWCNPLKWHLYDDFIKPQKEWNIPDYRKFIQILYSDNPHLDHKKYEESLRDANKVTRERLLKWNWDYDNTPWRLYNYDDLLDMWTNPITNWEKYITCDVARLGVDKAVIKVRDWLQCIRTVIYKQCTLDVLENKIKELAQQYHINMRNVLVDADGIWAWVVDNLKCQWFNWGSSPHQTAEMKRLDIKPNYQNLKTQCYFMLQDYIRQIRIEDESIKEELVEELDAIVEIDIDKDGKKKIIKKEDLKEKLGRSPDLADTVMMRMRFELEPARDYTVLLEALA